MHELKCWPESYRAISAETKTHEVRKFDRDFKVGDLILLREWEPSTSKYTGWSMVVKITYITPPGKFGLPDDVGVLSITRTLP